jgi:spore germination protein YaaH
MTIAARVLAILQVGVLASVSVACANPTESDDRPGGGLRVAGYLVPWDPRSQPTAGAGVLTEVSPVWLQPTDTGMVVYASEQARSSAATIGSSGMPLTPSISNFRDGRWDGELIDALVSDPQRRAAHIAAIVDLVRTRQWPGIDIDYESLPASSRAGYSAFVIELAAALDRLPAQLSVTVHAKTSEPGGWHGAQAQDWQAIGAAADQVRVMAYDYSSAGSPPGPVAPAPWVDEVLALAASLVPPDRITLGLPTYGYDWTANAPGTPVQWADVRAIADARGAPPQWDAGQASPWLRYLDDQGREHTVWYEDARSLATKLDIAGRFGVSRVVLWRLGGEDPDIWPTLRAAQ